MRDLINDKDTQGFNCLYYAAYHGHLRIVQILKKMNIDYAKDKKGTSCLHVAITRGHDAITEFLLRKTPRSELNDLQNSPNVSPDRNKKAEGEDKKKSLKINQLNKAMKWEQNVDCDEQRDNEGISGVFFAIRSGNMNCLTILKKYGADFNLECVSESGQKMRPVQYAVYRGNYTIYKFILECNQDSIQE